MKTTLLALLALVALGSCTDPMTVPDPLDVEQTAPPALSICCVYYEATTEWRTCWACGVTTICVGVPCQDGIPSCEAGAPRRNGEGASSYPDGGVACIE